MPPARRTLITLSAALLLGVALGLAGPREKKPPPEVLPSSAAVSAPAAPAAGPASSRDGTASSSARTSAVSKPDACAAAWDLLQQRDLRRSERQELETALLEEWCKIDLRAALHAAIASYPTYNEDPFRWSPVSTCLEEVSHQPDLVWELISSRQYGLHTRDLRGEWMDTCAGRQPLEILRRLPELPADERAHAIFKATHYTHEQDEPAPGKDEVVAAVLALRGTPDVTAAMDGFAKGLAVAMESSELEALLLVPPDPELRDFYLMAYAAKVDRSALQGDAPDVHSLPPGLRAEVEAAVKARRGK